MSIDEAFAPAAQPAEFFTWHGEVVFPVVRDQHHGERQHGQNQRGPPAAAKGKLLSIKEVAARLNMGTSTIYAKVRLGKFPAPFKNLSGLNVWRESVIDQHVEQLEAERPGEKGANK